MLKDLFLYEPGAFPWHPNIKIFSIDKVDIDDLVL